MTAKHLVIGLDGADLEVVYSLGAERLPHLFALMERGAYAHLESVQPPATLPNWTTFLTGMDPGRHGVFDFTTRHGYGVRFTAGTVREAPTLAARLDRMGKRCACVGFPATWPPERLEHGVFISGWDAPVAFEADRSFVWPPALHDALTERFGAMRFDEVDQFAAGQSGWHARLGDALVDKVGRRAELADFLLEREDWDLFAFYFGESDTASHYLWSLHDPGSPRRPEHVSSEEASGFARVYAALDAAVGRMLERAGPDAEVTLVSDHGSGGSGRQVLYLNRVLEQAGLLAFRDGAGEQRPGVASRLKDLALTRLPPRLRDRLFRAAGARLPSWLESRARFGAIDMCRTQAFSDELNYFPAVWLNLRGREPRGQVTPAQRAAVVARVREALLSLRAPDGRRPVVKRVWERHELFDGPHLRRAPDLLLDLHLDRGYSYNLMPSSGPGEFWRELGPEEYLGRKGRSLPGSHRSHGLWVAAGPQVRRAGQLDLHIADASAVMLARMGVAVPADAMGKVPAGLLREAGERAQIADAPAPRKQQGDAAQVESRLRALGYID